MEKYKRFTDIFAWIGVSEEVVEKVEKLTDGKIKYDSTITRFMETVPGFENSELAGLFNDIIYVKATNMLFEKVAQAKAAGTAPIRYDIIIDLDEELEKTIEDAYKGFMVKRELDTAIDDIVLKLCAIPESQVGIGIKSEASQKIDDIIKQLVEQIKLNKISINEAKKRLIEQTKDIVIEALARYIEHIEEQEEEDREDCEDDDDCDP